MSMRQLAATCAFVTGLALGAGAACAGSIGIPLTTVDPDGSAALSGTSMILQRAPGGSNGFSFVFVLPQDYEANRKVQIVFYLRASSAGCDFRIVATGMTRHRDGLAIESIYGGLTPADGSTTVSFSGTNVVVAKVFNLRKSDQPGLRKGDALLMRLAREGTAADTCVGHYVAVVAIDIRYPSVPPAP